MYFHPFSTVINTNNVNRFKQKQQNCKYEMCTFFLKPKLSPDLFSLWQPKGKNHLASTRIIGSKAYPKTKPRIYNYDTARVGREVNVMSHYSANRSQAKSDVDEGKQKRLQRKREKLLEKQKVNNEIQQQQQPEQHQQTEPKQTPEQPPSEEWRACSLDARKTIVQNVNYNHLQPYSHTTYTNIHRAYLSHPSLLWLAT